MPMEYRQTNAPHTDCFEHVQGAHFVFCDGKSGYGNVPYYKVFQKIHTNEDQ